MHIQNSKPINKIVHLFWTKFLREMLSGLILFNDLHKAILFCSYLNIIKRVLLIFKTDYTLIGTLEN